MIDAGWHSVRRCELARYTGGIHGPERHSDRHSVLSHFERLSTPPSTTFPRLQLFRQLTLPFVVSCALAIPSVAEMSNPSTGFRLLGNEAARSECVPCSTGSSWRLSSKDVQIVDNNNPWPNTSSTSSITSTSQHTVVLDIWKTSEDHPSHSFPTATFPDHTT